MIRVDICDASQQPYDSYNDPDTSKRHVRTSTSIGAFLSISSDSPVNFLIEVDGNVSELRRIEGSATTTFVSLQELIASTSKPSKLSRLMSFTGSPRSELTPVTEFRISFEDPTGNSLRGAIIFKLQEEDEFDSTYGDRVRARPARPDDPQFTNDATSIETGVRCWNCHKVLAAGAKHCNYCDHDQ